MYIAPNSTIKILKGVPLDPTYEHTLYWEVSSNPSSEIARQANYFSSKAKYTLSNQSYQRANKGRMRIEKRAEDLYDCNYIMFQNTSFGNKWFYAFLKSVEYVNNEVSEVEYEIDVIQTWYFNFTLSKCFIERAHSVTDNPYENTVPENLNLGNDYVCSLHGSIGLNTTGDIMKVCILMNRKPSEDTPRPSSYRNGVYTACVTNLSFRANETSSIDAFLDTYQQDDIIAIYQYPDFISGDFIDDPNIKVPVVQDNVFGSYVAKNKKLLSYPYSVLYISNNNGDVREYKYEHFSLVSGMGPYPLNAGFNLRGVSITEPCVILSPRNYKNIADAYDDGILISNFPQCAWAGDTFKAWWAQNKNSYQTSLITTAINGLVNTSTGAIKGATSDANARRYGAVGGGVLGGIAPAISTASSVAQQLAAVEDIKNKPNKTFGTAQTSTLSAKFGKYKFDYYCMQIKEEYARIIDGYFERYGYAQNKFDYPSRKSRPHWTYCKTIGCEIVGTSGVPADDAKKICSIFDNGITHWVNPSEVGNYNLDNRPV